jgi:hypothetical protein
MQSDDSQTTEQISIQEAVDRLVAALREHVRFADKQSWFDGLVLLWLIVLSIEVFWR